MLCLMFLQLLWQCSEAEYYERLGHYGLVLINRLMSFPIVVTNATNSYLGFHDSPMQQFTGQQRAGGGMHGVK